MATTMVGEDRKAHGAGNGHGVTGTFQRLEANR